MVYGIVNASTKKRIRLLSGELTPIFHYPIQAQHYIDKILGGSSYITYKKLGGELK